MQVKPLLVLKMNKRDAYFYIGFSIVLFIVVLLASFALIFDVGSDIFSNYGYYILCVIALFVFLASLPNSGLRLKYQFLKYHWKQDYALVFEDRIEFPFYNAQIYKTDIQELLKEDYGIRILTPEYTALDLVGKQKFNELHGYYFLEFVFMSDVKNTIRFFKTWIGDDNFRTKKPFKL